MRRSLATALFTAVRMVERTLGHELAQKLEDSCACAMPSRNENTQNKENPDGAMAENGWSQLKRTKEPQFVFLI